MILITVISDLWKWNAEGKSDGPISLSLDATCVGLCRFGEAWAALRAENLLTYLQSDGT